MKIYEFNEKFMDFQSKCIDSHDLQNFNQQSTDFHDFETVWTANCRSVPFMEMIDSTDEEQYSKWTQRSDPWRQDHRTAGTRPRLNESSQGLRKTEDTTPWQAVPERRGEAMRIVGLSRNRQPREGCGGQIMKCRKSYG